MKTKIYSALCAAGLLAMTACTADDPMVAATGDGPVTFKISVPGQPGSRAYADGTQADQLSFRIYDVTGGTETMVYEKTVTPSYTPGVNGNRVTNLQVDLANGREYQIVWWAQNSGCNAYSFAGKSVSVDYSKIAHNSDAADAFYAFTPTFKVQGSAAREVTLRRPFAQINFGTSDMAAESAVLAPVYGADYGNLVSKLTITSPLATTLDLTDGTVGGDTDEDITFSYTKPGIDEAFPVAEHKYVGMVYVLAGETGIADLNLTIGNGSQDCTTVSVPSAPIRANFRTNIYGKLLTSPNDFNITLDPFMETLHNQEYWDGKTAKAVKPVTKTINGVSTEVYEVASPSELLWIANEITGKNLQDAYIELSGDVDLQGIEWAPISNCGRSSTADAFTGTFDGQGHTISNFKYSNSADKMQAGLFGTVNNATIKNITVAKAEFTSVDGAGAIVGTMLGATTIENCIVANTVKVKDNGAAGGIAGRAYGTNNTIKDCVNYASVSGTTATSSSKLGGIVGIASAGGATTTITGCTNYGNIGHGTSGQGGIVGYFGANTATISNCKNYGVVGVDTNNSTQLASGGIVGNVQQTGTIVTISDCENGGDVFGGLSGGIHGAVGSYQAVNISNCTNSGDIYGTSVAGGISGDQGAGTTENCKNTGKVTASAAAGMAGGVVGSLKKANVINCAGGTAAITGDYAGRIIGVTRGGYPDVNTLMIDDNNGDSYENINTLGSHTYETALAMLDVKAGTFHGAPVLRCEINYGSWIRINEGASWDIYPGETGTYYFKNGAWTNK